MEERPHARRRFTQEEDQKLTELVEKYGKRWKIIVKEFNNGLTERQCRERYSLRLDKNINKTPWTPEEDDLLRSLYKKHGGKWSILKQFFDHRTDCDIKNHFTTLQNREKSDARRKIAKNQDNPTKSTKQHSYMSVTEARAIQAEQQSSNQFDQLFSSKPENFFSRESQHNNLVKPPGKIINEFLARSYYDEFPFDI